MKNLSLVINGMLAVAVIVSSALFFSGCANSSTNDTASVDKTSTDSVVTSLPIAYVNVDSLLTNYAFAKVESEKLMNRFKSVNSTVTQKQKQLQSEAVSFQEKYQKGLFISPESAQKEQQRLQKLEMDLGQMAQRMEQELARDEMKINEQIADSVRLCLKEYNAKANYEIIFSNKGMDNILIAKEKYDITNEVLEILNSRYKAPEQPAKK